MAATPEAFLLNSSGHGRYLRRSLDVLPPSVASLDTSRITVAYFALSGLDVLGHDHFLQDQELKERCIRWIRGLYVAESGRAGFHGGNALKSPDSGHLRPYEHPGHVAMTYTALSCLRLLGDDLSGLDERALVTGVAALQQDDGSVVSSLESAEKDMRFVYCAAAVCYLLDEWSGFDVNSAVDYILSCLSYEGAFGQEPTAEAHGGSTFCALAALALMNKLDALIPHRRRRLERWLVMRMSSEEYGFNGRPNKPVDTCYTFWVGASLAILRPFEEISAFCRLSARFALSSQDEVTGGLAKWPDFAADPLHTYLGLAGLAAHSFPKLRPLDPALNLTLRAKEGREGDEDNEEV